MWRGNKNYTWSLKSKVEDFPSLQDLFLWKVKERTCLFISHLYIGMPQAYLRVLLFRCAIFSFAFGKYVHAKYRAFGWGEMPCDFNERVTSIRIQCCPTLLLGISDFSQFDWFAGITTNHYLLSSTLGQYRLHSKAISNTRSWHQWLKISKVCLWLWKS